MLLAEQGAVPALLAVPAPRLEQTAFEIPSSGCVEECLVDEFSLTLDDLESSSQARRVRGDTVALFRAHFVASNNRETLSSEGGARRTR